MPAQPVVVLGPVAWNTIIVLDELPERRPHMVAARESWDAVGGTSAGKAIHLADLGVACRLATPLAGDEPGARVRTALRRLGAVTLEELPTGATERHVNLMTYAGQRLSIYAKGPATTTEPPSPSSLGDARAVVLDLSPWTRDLAPALAREGLPVWTDLHDVWPGSEWHEPFWRAASVVQCSAENLPSPRDFLHRLVDDGVRLAICTVGADGAVAVDADHIEHAVPAVPCDVVDSNGAGDAFFAGVLAATLAGATPLQALRAGAAQAPRALGTRDLGPGVTTGAARSS